MRQRDLLLPWRTALDNAAIALENGEVPRAEARTRTRPLFERFGLASFENARPAQLSGCMCQRVSFLPTLMAEKDVLLLDEPFGALDSITRAQMQEWLVQAMAAIPRTVLLVTHDVEEAFATEPARGRVLDANRGAARAPPRGKRTSAPGQANLRASEPRTPRGRMSPR
jgi:NitT/TauT family transport system ATP-binding protein